MQVKRANASTWTAKNRVLKSGQFGFEKDTKRLKIGDGVTSWNNLNYVVLNNNLTALRNPDESDYLIYSQGSLWFNHSDNSLWICKSITSKTAVWTKINGFGN